MAGPERNFEVFDSPDFLAEGGGGDNGLETDGGPNEDKDMNQKASLTLASEKVTERFAFWRRFCPSTRMIGTVAVAVLLCSVLGCHDPARDKMEAMIKRAQKQFSPGELQAAVTSVCATNDSSYVPVQCLPHEILDLSEAEPIGAYVTINGGGKGTLVVFWGGMESWGIGVCPPGGHLDTNIVAHMWRWSDGVFFFYE